MIFSRDCEVSFSNNAPSITCELLSSTEMAKCRTVDCGICSKNVRTLCHFRTSTWNRNVGLFLTFCYVFSLVSIRTIKINRKFVFVTTQYSRDTL